MCTMKAFRIYVHVVLVLFAFTSNQNAQALLVRQYSFNEYPMPAASWTVHETKEKIKTITECVELAQQTRKYALAYDGDSQTCQVGTVDFEITDGAGGHVQVFLRGIQQCGLKLLILG